MDPHLPLTGLIGTPGTNWEFCADWPVRRIGQRPPSLPDDKPDRSRRDAGRSSSRLSGLVFFLFFFIAGSFTPQTPLLLRITPGHLALTASRRQPPPTRRPSLKERASNHLRHHPPPASCEERKQPRKPPQSHCERFIPFTRRRPLVQPSTTHPSSTTIASAPPKSP